MLHSCKILEIISSVLFYDVLTSHTGYLFQSIPTCIKDICSDSDDLEHVSRHRVIVCTCTTAGVMYSLGLCSGHFTHTFIDEVRIVLVYVFNLTCNSMKHIMKIWVYFSKFLVYNFRQDRRQNLKL